MIDLKKLEAKFEALFEQETEESFNAWLEEKRKKETLAYLGEGYVELLKTVSHTQLQAPSYLPVAQILNDSHNYTAGNTQYVMAA